MILSENNSLKLLMGITHLEYQQIRDRVKAGIEFMSNVPLYSNEGHLEVFYGLQLKDICETVEDICFISSLIVAGTQVNTCHALYHSMTLKVMGEGQCIACGSDRYEEMHREGHTEGGTHKDGDHDPVFVGAVEYICGNCQTVYEIADLVQNGGLSNVRKCDGCIGHGKRLLSTPGVGEVRWDKCKNNNSC